MLKPFLQRKFFLPSEHGAWIWWIGPFLVGMAAAGRWSTDLPLLLLAMLAAFLIRQPLTMVVKTISGRRPPMDRNPGLAWVALYGILAGSAFAVLLTRGFGRLILLLIPGIPVFIWHLYLVSQRAERGQRGIEIVGAGVLALAAPASYWVAGGDDPVTPWILWTVTWLQSAASIVLVYQRLLERRLDQPGNFRVKIRRAARALGYHSFNLMINVLVVVYSAMPWPLVLASALMWVDAADTLRQPAIGWKPTRIGIRQLMASSLYMLIVILGFTLAA